VDVVGTLVILLLFAFLVPVIPVTLPFCQGGPPPQGYYSLTFLLFGAGVVFYDGVARLMWSGFPFCQ